MDEIEYAKKVVKEIPKTISGLKSMKRLAEIELEHLTPRHDINEFLDMMSIFDIRIKEYTVKRETLVRYLQANGYEKYCFNNIFPYSLEHEVEHRVEPTKKEPFFKRIFSFFIRT